MTKNYSTILCFLMVFALANAGCKAVDSATGANNANVGQSLRQNNRGLTRKELSLRLRRLAMTYLGDVRKDRRQVVGHIHLYGNSATHSSASE